MQCLRIQRDKGLKCLTQDKITNLEVHYHIEFSICMSHFIVAITTCHKLGGLKWQTYSFSFEG